MQTIRHAPFSPRELRATSPIARAVILGVSAAWLLLAAASPAAAQNARAPAAPDNPPASAPAPGIGDLLVAPTRLVFENRTRTAELTLLNIGGQIATYRISFSHLQMTETGELKEIETPEPGAPFADALIRYSPRQVTLAPNVAQTIRLQLRKPESLADGEYRSHLLFRAVPSEQAIPGNVVENDPSKKPTGFSIRLTPIYGVSIPVIVRHGQTSAKVGIAALTVTPPRENRPATLTLKMERRGNESVYGNLKAVWVPAGGREQVVGIVNGIAVYTPNADRLIEVPLQLPAGATLTKGRLRVTFQRAEQNGELLASAETAIP